MYRSPEVGLMNRWSLFLREDQVAVINIRGTVKNATSWSANFYAPMIPATGSLQLNDSTVFNYQLAENPGAAVHAGWTIALAHLAPSILEQVNQLYKGKGIRQFIVSGHSQGVLLLFSPVLFCTTNSKMEEYQKILFSKPIAVRPLNPAT